jgi:hypothetical protein
MDLPIFRRFDVFTIISLNNKLKERFAMCSVSKETKTTMTYALGFYSCLAVVLLFSCSHRVVEETPPAPSFEHQYPYTKHLGEHHVSMDVDHAQNKIFLFFKDSSEKPTPLIEIDNIHSKVIFPDGTEEELTFYADPDNSRRFLNKRRVCKFIAHEEWIQRRQVFKIYFSVPCKGKQYNIKFDYEAPKGEIQLYKHHQ